jgi:hypothetical protein
MALADGMDVLNMSIGDAFNNWAGSPTAVASDALVDAGLVVVAAIGNSGANGIYSAGAPGVGDKVIGVASYDNSHVRVAGSHLAGGAGWCSDSTSNSQTIPDPPNPPVDDPIAGTPAGDAVRQAARSFRRTGARRCRRHFTGGGMIRRACSFTQSTERQGRRCNAVVLYSNAAGGHSDRYATPRSGSRS